MADPKIMDSNALLYVWQKIKNLLSEKADNAAIPTNNNQLVNGAGYQTATEVEVAITNKNYTTMTDVEAKGYQNATQVDEAITDALADFTTIDIHICQDGEYDTETSVPTIEGKKGTFYLVPKGSSDSGESTVDWGTLETRTHEPGWAIFDPWDYQYAKVSMATNPFSGDTVDVLVNGEVVSYTVEKDSSDFYLEYEGNNSYWVSNGQTPGGWTWKDAEEDGSFVSTGDWCIAYDEEDKILQFYGYEVTEPVPTLVLANSSTTETNNSYYEFIWDGDDYEKIGDTTIDLSNYLNKDEIITTTEVEDLYNQVFGN